MSNGPKKFDSGKPRISLIDPEFILELAHVLTVGAKKYGDNNWKKGFDYSRLYDAAQRHQLTFLAGESYDYSEDEGDVSEDTDTGSHHLICAVANLMMLWYHDRHGIGRDDRFSDVEELGKDAHYRIFHNVVGGHPVWVGDLINEDIVWKDQSEIDDIVKEQRLVREAAYRQSEIDRLNDEMAALKPCCARSCDSDSSEFNDLEAFEGDEEGFGMSVDDAKPIYYDLDGTIADTHYPR